VISSSSAESKGIITKPETLHVCYCHSPTRYYWSHTHEYSRMLEFGILNPIARLFMPMILNRLRIWDRLAADRVDAFVANSRNSALRIAKYYRQNAEVITPGIDSERFAIETEKEDFYLALGRMIPYKRFDLLVDAFNENGKPLKIATNTENALFKELFKKSKPNIEWILGPSNEEKIRLYQTAKAFVFPPEEDFGLVPIEAMLCGTPVIAYAKGGALETVKEGVSGLFFTESTKESLNSAIEQFENERWSAYEIRKYALKFDKKIFQERMVAHIESLL
jgi:glycosyltransferase involved in cell wall biosynthesis